MVLELKNLSFYYPYTRFDILNGLSAEWTSGRLIFLYAPEGGGKTTLLKAIAGRIFPQGKILLDGEDITNKLMSERNIAYTDKSFMFFPHRSVLYNLEFPLKIRRVKKAERRKIIGELVNGTPIESIIGKKIKKLAYSERLDVLLLRLRVLKRDIILFDGILAGAEESKKSAAEKIVAFAEENRDKIIVYAGANGEDTALFTDAAVYTLDCGKMLEGVVYGNEESSEE